MTLISFVSIPVISNNKIIRYCCLPIDHPLLKNRDFLNEDDILLNQLDVICKDMSGSMKID